MASLRTVLFPARLLLTRQIPTLTTAQIRGKKRQDSMPEPTNWKRYNDVVYPPQEPGQLKRPAEIYHSVNNIKGSPDKLWYVACLIRGMSIDEALKQLSFNKMGGAPIVRDALLECQNMAVKEHNVEYKSNLWVAQSHVTKSRVLSGYRYHSRGRFSQLRHPFCHYFVKLREGKPPKQYYSEEPNGWQKYEEHIKRLRMRTIQEGL